jgi:hypothetical protein
LKRKCAGKHTPPSTILTSPFCHSHSRPSPSNTASPIHHLTNGAAPDELREHARFFINYLPKPTARPDQIKQIRQAILNLAVRGKLVPQDPSDSPLGMRDRNRPQSAFTPFRIPKKWQWVRPNSLGTLKGGGTPSEAIRHLVKTTRVMWWSIGRNKKRRIDAQEPSASPHDRIWAWTPQKWKLLIGSLWPLRT